MKYLDKAVYDIISTIYYQCMKSRHKITGNDELHMFLSKCFNNHLRLYTSVCDLEFRDE